MKLKTAGFAIALVVPVLAACGGGDTSTGLPTSVSYAPLPTNVEFATPTSQPGTSNDGRIPRTTTAKPGAANWKVYLPEQDVVSTADGSPVATVAATPGGSCAGYEANRFVSPEGVSYWCSTASGAPKLVRAQSQANRTMPADEHLCSPVGARELDVHDGRQLVCVAGPLDKWQVG